MITRIAGIAVGAVLYGFIIFGAAYSTAHNLIAAIWRPLYQPFVRLHKKVQADEYRQNANTPNPY